MLHTGPRVEMARSMRQQLHEPHSLAAPFVVAELPYRLALVATARQRLDAVDHALALLPTSCMQTFHSLRLVPSCGLPHQGLMFQSHCVYEAAKL